MNVAIKELKDVINRNEKLRNEAIDFFKTQDFRVCIREPVDKNIDFTIYHTNRIYDEYIGEIQKSIDILERVGCSRRKKYRRRNAK